MLVGEATNFKQDQTTVTSLIAYLVGVKRESLKFYFDSDPDGLIELDKNENTRVLRSLCKIRTNLLSNFLKTERAIIYDLKNLNTLDDFKDDVKILEKFEVYIVKSGYRVNKYIVLINELVIRYIDQCKSLFPEWIEWNYIRKLFIMPNGTKEECIKEESFKYNGSRSFYPYGMYINWNPVNEGNIVYNDKKFLHIIYEQNGSSFGDYNKVLDANSKVKTNIYEFIDNNDSTAIVVDCENSDPYKLFAVLKNLNQDEVNKVKKLILYDDENYTSGAWRNFDKFLSIPVEHIQIDRLKDNKSLVDLRMCSGISTYFYRDNISSFIIVSSDSDYWAIISSLPEANYLVMIEYEKCGPDIKNALESKGIFYCAIDDFCSGNINEFKALTLLQELDKRIDNAIDLNAKILLETIFTSARLPASEVEKKNFFDKYIKKLRLKIDGDNNFFIERD